MTQTLSANLFKDTPTITVMDNRGLNVRSVQFNRRINEETPSALDTLISHNHYNAIGQLTASADPRFFDQGTNNLTQIASLTGQTLRVDSIDAGWRVSLPDITQAPHKEWEQRGTLRRYEYDTDFHRPTAVIEQPDANASEQVTERFIYGDAQAVSNNLNQQLIRHYDNAGLSTINSLSLTGQTLSEKRQLLSSLTDDSNWQGNTEAWQASLANTAYTTHWTCNALGTQLSQSDAKGNRQRSEYDVAGYLSATYLQVADADTEQSIVSAIEYNANGQKTHETAGNGVESTYTYDERDWRLMQTQTRRPQVEGRTTLLQDLHYQYDPVGNILSIDDATQAAHYYKNQKITAKCQYEYDALYQLTFATGRENDNAPRQSSALPPLNDSNQYVNYTRTYQYDRSGNQTQVRHTGASPYTQDRVVSNQSNRAVQQLSTHSITPDQVDGYFDAHGNLQQLEHSKNLNWGRRDQLKQARVTANQQETYQYAVQGSRVRKTFSDTGTHSEHEVIYLPGLELRLSRQQGEVNEELHVVSIANTGRAQVRWLHWASGKPADESDIPNNQCRYTLDNHLGSSYLELDQQADILTMEEYYPFGGTAVYSAKSATEARYKTIRYSGKERDVTGLYYYGYRYYAPWMGRWLNPDPAGTVDGLNLYRMVRNNPINLKDTNGLDPIGAPQENGLYEPKIRAGSERVIPNATPVQHADYIDDKVLEVKPGPLRDVLSEEAIARSPVMTDLFSPWKGELSQLNKETIENPSGGEMFFRSLKTIDNKYSALQVTSHDSRSSAEIAYWAPQGGYVDIPIKPVGGESELVLTPGFSGCSLVVDKLDSEKLRVRHVQGGKEDVEYNNSNIDHGEGMVNAMEYHDYGYHQDKADETKYLENITAFAFMKFDRKAGHWNIHYQSVMNIPAIGKIEETSPGFISQLINEKKN